MTTQIVLTLALGVLAVLLIYLVLTRIQTERRLALANRYLNLVELAEVLRSNSVDGKIHIVAAKVSELLKSSFGCQKIIFLRKQRGQLDLNYYHGIFRFNRAEFRLPFSQQLADRLRESFLPQPIASLESVIPALAMQRLKAEELDLFFPVFWRDNLYGVYFVRTASEVSNSGFRLLVASLAHSLSAAYHVRWHEARLERLEQDVAATAQHSGSAIPRPELSPSSSLPILKLVRHASSESLIPQLVGTVQHQLGASRAIMIYETKSSGGSLVASKSGTVDRIESPSRELFDHLIQSLDRRRVGPLDHPEPLVSDWAAHLRSHGFHYVARFSPFQGKKGLIALDHAGSPGEIEAVLSDLEDSTQALVTNAELFDEMQALSYTDSLTGLSNQRYFRKRLKEEIDRAKRYSRSLALIIFDMDDLKSINDRYGHLAGDAVIQRMGPLLRSCIRAIDIVARYGGDEFCVIMPEADAAMCERFMERLHLKFSDNHFQISELEVELPAPFRWEGRCSPIRPRPMTNLSLRPTWRSYKLRPGGATSIFSMLPQRLQPMEPPPNRPVFNLYTLSRQVYIGLLKQSQGNADSS